MESMLISELLIPLTADEKSQDPPEASKEAPEEGGVSKETPETEQPGDDSQEPSVQDLQKQLEESQQAYQKLQQDLNNTKASLDRRATETQKEYEDRLTAYRKELDQAKMAGMDEVQQAEYNATVLERELREEREKRAELEKRLETEQAQQAWADEFSKAGVSLNAMPGNDLNEKFQAALAEVIKKAANPAQPDPQKKGKDPVKAPDVVTDSPKEAKPASNLQDIIKQFQRQGESDNQTLVRLQTEVVEGKRSPAIFLGSEPSPEE